VVWAEGIGDKVAKVALLDGAGKIVAGPSTFERSWEQVGVAPTTTGFVLHEVLKTSEGCYGGRVRTVATDGTLGAPVDMFTSCGDWPIWGTRGDVVIALRNQAGKTTRGVELAVWPLTGAPTLTAVVPPERPAVARDVVATATGFAIAWTEGAGKQASTFTATLDARGGSLGTPRPAPTPVDADTDAGIVGEQLVRLREHRGAAELFTTTWTKVSAQKCFWASLAQAGGRSWVQISPDIDADPVTVVPLDVAGTVAGPGFTLPSALYAIDAGGQLGAVLTTTKGALRWQRLTCS
jgi:hypothetical protein